MFRRIGIVISATTLVLGATWLIMPEIFKAFLLAVLGILILTLGALSAAKLSQSFTITRTHNAVARADELEAHNRQRRALADAQHIPYRADLDLVGAMNTLARSQYDLLRDMTLLHQLIRQGTTGLTTIDRTPDGIQTKQIAPATAKTLGKGQCGSDNAPPPLPIPDLVRLDDLLAARAHSIRHIILGATHGGQIITADMVQLFHILVAGTSRWGKSVFLQSLLYQILSAPEHTKTLLIDLSDNTFNNFRLPVATDAPEAADALADAWRICQQRKALFSLDGHSFKTLEAYNTATGSDLPYVFVFADEVTGILDRKNKLEFNQSAANHMTRLAGKAAKYGVYLEVAGQDMKSEVMPTTVRNQFGSRFQFKTMDSYQSRVLLPDCSAHSIGVKGRAFAQMNETGHLLELQTPYVDDAMVDALVAHKASKATPKQRAREQDVDPFEMVIVQMYQRGESLSACYRKYHQLQHGEVPQSIGGKQTTLIKDILRKHGVPPMY